MGEAMPARDGMRCAWRHGGARWRCMGRDALREGACVKERGAAAAAARRCTAEAHGWHALESCGLAQKRTRAAGQLARDPVAAFSSYAIGPLQPAGARQRTNKDTSGVYGYKLRAFRVINLERLYSGRQTLPGWVRVRVMYSGVSFCYNLGPRASPKYKVAACVGPLRLSVRR